VNSTIVTPKNEIGTVYSIKSTLVYLLEIFDFYN